MSQTETVAVPAACDYCGKIDAHQDDCPNRAHEFGGNPNDPNDFCGACGHLFRDANHVVAIDQPPEDDPDDADVASGDFEIEADSATIGRVPDDDPVRYYETIVDGKEARVMREIPITEVTYPSTDVTAAIKRLETARALFAKAVEGVRDASALKKERQEHLNAAVDAVVDAMHAVQQPGLFS